MRSRISLSLVILFTVLSISCSKKTDEILAMLQEIKQQNSDLKAQVTNLQKTTDSLSNALKLANQNIASMDKKIDSIRNQLSSMVTQINSLSAQLNQANVNIIDLQKRIAELQAKCQQMLDLLKLITVTNSPSDGLIAFYPFNGNLLDSNVTSIKRDGVSGGIIFYNTDRFGLPGRSLGFSSSTEGYVKTPSSINDIVNTFTISCWVNPLSIDRLVNEGASGREGYGSQMFLHPTHGAVWGAPLQNSGVGISVGTNQIVVTEHTDGFVAAPLVYNGTLNGWHLITIVYENHIPKLYIDGVFAKNGLATNILNVRPSNGNDYNNGFGGYSTSGFGRGFSPTGTPPIPQFNGSIDEFRIYNRALTQSEITYLANN